MEFTKESLSVDKTMYSLVDVDFLKDTADVLSKGAKKYSRDNWQKCEDNTLYIDALYRHIESYRAGETADAETGISHLAHAACNLMFLHYMEKDDGR